MCGTQIRQLTGNVNNTNYLFMPKGQIVAASHSISKTAKLHFLGGVLGGARGAVK